MCRQLFVVTWLFAVLCLSSAGHFCQKAESYISTVTQTYQVTRQISSEYFCLSKIVCTRTKIAYTTRNRQVEKTETRQVQACCPGWIGDQCDIACAPGLYGDECSEICQCQNDATCHSADGSCVCAVGYRGALCDQKCQSGTHGYYCQSTCDSCSVDECHHVTGCQRSMSEDNLVTEIIQKNAVEIDVPVSEIGSPAGAQGNSGSRVATSINNNREGGGVNVKIILPVCLLVLIAILVVVIVFTKRRMNLVNKHTTDNVIVSYTAAPCQSDPRDAIDLENEANTHRQTHRQAESSSHDRSADLPAGAACSSDLVDPADLADPADCDDLCSKKCAEFDDESAIPAHMMSYRARMNNLNRGTSEDELDMEEEKLNNIDGGAVTIHLPRTSGGASATRPSLSHTPTAEKSSLLSNNGSSHGVECDIDGLSDDENC